MAYSKTTWVNDSTPAISAENLNKIEQALADSAGYDGVDELRDVTPVAGVTYYLRYHTSPDDGIDGVYRCVSGASAGTYTHDNSMVILPSGGNGSAAFLKVTPDNEYHIHKNCTASQVEAISDLANSQNPETTTAFHNVKFVFLPGDYEYSETISFNWPSYSSVTAYGCRFKANHNGVLFDLHPTIKGTVPTYGGQSLLISHASAPYGTLRTPDGTAISKLDTIWEGGTFEGTDSASNTLSACFQVFAMRNFTLKNASIVKFYTGVRYGAKDTYRFVNVHTQKCYYSFHYPRGVVHDSVVNIGETVGYADTTLDTVFDMCHVSGDGSGTYTNGFLIEGPFNKIMWLNGSCNGDFSGHQVKVNVNADIEHTSRAVMFNGFHTEQSENAIYVGHANSGYQIQGVSVLGGSISCEGDDLCHIELARVTGFTLGDGASIGGKGALSTSCIKWDINTTGLAINTSCLHSGITDVEGLNETWDAATSYVAGDLVSYDYKTYEALRSTTGDQPDISTSDWSERPHRYLDIPSGFASRNLQCLPATAGTLAAIGSSGNRYYQMTVSNWNSGTAYSVGNVVNRFASGDYRLFKCIQAHTNQDPATPNPSYWVEITDIDMTTYLAQLVQYKTRPKGYHVRIQAQASNAPGGTNRVSIGKAGSTWSQGEVEMNLDGLQSAEDYFMSGYVNADEEGDLAVHVRPYGTMTIIMYVTGITF